MPVILHVSLWPRAGQGRALIAYEDHVLPLLASHQAAVLQRMRTDGADGAPSEIQILRFPSESSLNDYMDDERRIALTGEREHAVERTEIVRVEVVS